jgi:hypothetical protein
MIDCRCAIRQRSFATGATLAAALVPKFGCPLCAPLLAAALATMGLSLQAVSVVLTALAILFVCIALYLLVTDRPNKFPAIFVLAFAVIILAYRLFELPPILRYLGSFGFAASLIVRALDHRRRTASIAARQS